VSRREPVMSGNNVKITEHDGFMRFEHKSGRYTTIDPEEVAALREHFAAERMPEDVQALVERVRGYLAVRDAAVPEVDGERFDIVHDIDHGSRGHFRLNASDVRRLTAALEAAYS